MCLAYSVKARNSKLELILETAGYSIQHTTPKSELDLFTVPPTQTSIGARQLGRVPSSVDGDRRIAYGSPTEFDVICTGDDYSDGDGDDSKSYVRPLLQLGTVTSVLVIRSDKQFCFHITTERGTWMLNDSCVSVLEENSRWTVLPRRSCDRTVSKRPCGWNRRTWTLRTASYTWRPK